MKDTLCIEYVGYDILLPVHLVTVTSMISKSTYEYVISPTTWQIS